jgi:hypothetical protein
MKTLSEAEIKTAAGKLGAYLLEKQHSIESLLNIVCRATDEVEAPKYDWEVSAAFRKAISGSSNERFFTVSSANSLHTIYPNARMNHAFRFWHDILHSTYGLGFNLKDELSAAVLHVNEIKRIFGSDSIEARIMDADTAGQSLYESIHKAFPKRQDLFVLDYILRGASAALSDTYN